MEIIKSECLCQNVATAVSEIRMLFRSTLPVPEILDRFWRLQDNLSRLLEAAADHFAETSEMLEQHPRLLTDVADVLESSAKLQALRTLAAVREATESINNSLLEIQYLQKSGALTASA